MCVYAGIEQTSLRIERARSRFCMPFLMRVMSRFRYSRKNHSSVVDLFSVLLLFSSTLSDSERERDLKIFKNVLKRVSSCCSLLYFTFVCLNFSSTKTNFFCVVSLGDINRVLRPTRRRRSPEGRSNGVEPRSS